MNIIIGYFSSFIFWNNKAQVNYKTNHCLLLSCNGKLSRTVGTIYGEKCMQTTECLLIFSSMRGTQQLSCPVLRPTNRPNAHPQDNIHLT